MSAVHQAVDKFIQKFDHLGQATKVSLFLSLIIFTAIPVTVMALYSYRTLTSSASVSLSINLKPAGTVETNPVFSWACFCQPAKFLVYLREGNSNFGAGKWIGTVVRNKTVNNTPQKLAYNNGFNWVGINYPVPGALKPGKTYYWTVAACDSSCTNSPEVKSFKTPPSSDTQAPSIPQIAAFIVSGKKVTLGWFSSTDNIGVAGYEVFRNGSPLKTVNSNAVDDTNVNFGTTYKYRVRAFDVAGNRSAFSEEKVAADLFTDNDNDSFVNSQESFNGTNLNLACGVNAWPIDFNDDKTINSLDLLLLAQHKGSVDKRYDLNVDGIVNDADVQLEGSYFGKTCS